MSDHTIPDVGDLVEVEIEKLVAGGEGLGRADGLVVFARPAFPGDRVRVRITESRKSFVRGVVEERLESGPDRKAAPCPIADRCGGCDWTSYRLDAQLRARKSILAESLTRVGKLDSDEIPEIRLHASALNYRLRSRLHFDDEGAPGFYEHRSHVVIPLVSECEVIGPLLRRQIEEGRIAGEPGSDQVFLENEIELIAGDRAEGSDSSLQFAVRGLRYDVTPDSFFQVNRHLLGTLVDLILTHADSLPTRERALDLYGGSGFFAVPLATRFGKVVTVESNETAHRLAKQNAAGFSLEARQSDVLDFLRQETKRSDMIVLDPPRSGVHPEVIDGIDQLDPALVSYLSCDPVNLARDLGRFRRLGWSIGSIDLIDLFPNTHHVETLVSLRRS